MYKKDEIKELKGIFWQKFEGRMKKIRSMNNGNKINWQHYRTNIHHVYFRLETNDNDLKLCIDLQHRDKGIRELFYQQFIEVKTVMQSFFKDELVFQENYLHPNGLEISRIYVELKNVNYLNEEEHDQTIQFFEKNLRALDKFWTEYQDLFFQLK
ncbi:MAG: DUF4268 domain-containing protein [Bacteroidia bacterium]